MVPVRSSATDGSGRRHFVVEAWGRSLALHADTEEEEDRWRACIELSVASIRTALEAVGVKRGGLFKRGEWGKWTKRWFVLEGGTHPRLRYFDSPASAAENAQPLGQATASHTAGYWVYLDVEPVVN